MTNALMITMLSAPFVMGAPVPQEPPQKVAPPEVIVQCYDDSSLRVTLLDEAVTLQTKYGELKVPAVAIRKVEFANRTPPHIQAQIDAAVKNLGHPDFKTREEAEVTLRDLKDRAYSAAVAACKSSDPEVARRAQAVCGYLKNKYGSANLVLREQDTIFTEDSKLSGKFKAESLKVQTAQFGEQSLRLSDLKSLRHKDEAPAVDPNAPAAPANLNSPTYQNKFGEEFLFKLTGATPQPGQTGIWGTDQYTLDSNLAVAGVHAGVVQNGQTAVVRVRIVASPPQFVGLERNGVTSTQYGNFPAGAFEFVR